MTNQRKEFITFCKLSGFSDATTKGYVYAVAKLSKRFNMIPMNISSNQIKQFLVELYDDGKSDKFIAGMFYGIKKFYISINQTNKIQTIPNPKRVYNIPTVLSLNEVNKVLGSSNGIREKIITGILYATGIRIGELVNLKLNDLDSERKTIFISKPKNGRPRHVMLSNKTIELINYYKTVYKPTEFLLYPNNDKSSSLSTRQIQSIIQTIIKRSKILKKVSAHTLRHSFATHLLESGCNIINIQKLLGHSSISSTAIYLHVESSTFLKVKSPFDGTDSEVSQPLYFMGQQGLSFNH